MENKHYRDDVRKAMAYDLLEIFKTEPEKNYTSEELEKLISAYIQGND